MGIIRTIIKKYNALQYCHRLKRAKLGIVYSFFDCKELIEKSIEQIRDSVDFICVAYQNESWYGDKFADNETIEFLEALKGKRVIDEYFVYDFTESKKTIQDKKLYGVIGRKRKMAQGLGILKKNKCTHVMFMDVDEFYDKDEFKKAKEFIIGNGYTHSAVVMHGYFYKPTFRMLNINNTTVPFILKIKPFKFISAHGMPCLVDGARCLNFTRIFDKFYFYTHIYMHHMTRVRKNIDDKFNYSDMYAAGVSTDIERQKNDYMSLMELVDKYDDKSLLEIFSAKLNMPLVEVEDKFGLNEIFGFKKK